MAWANDSRLRIAVTLGYALDGASMMPIDQAMRIISEFIPIRQQQSVDYIEGLLDEWDGINATVIATDSNAQNGGLIKLDVIEWSDRQGVRTEGAMRLRDEIAERVAIALGISKRKLGANGSARRIRS